MCLFGLFLCRDASFEANFLASRLRLWCLDMFVCRDASFGAIFLASRLLMAPWTVDCMRIVNCHADRRMSGGAYFTVTFGRSVQRVV